MSDWRQRIRDTLAGVATLDFYSADPGGTALLRHIRAEAGNAARHWYADGWALQANLPGARPADDMEEDLRGERPAPVLSMGQQVDFALGYLRLAQALRTGAQIWMFSDHWEDISGLFKPAPDARLLLPHRLYVPDVRAGAVQVEGLVKRGASRADCERLVMPFLQPAVEDSAERIAAMAEEEKARLRGVHGKEGASLILLVLDPDRPELTAYGWRDFLDDALKDAPEGAVLLVKPHPRQDAGAVARHLEPLPAAVRMVEGAPEPHVAIADEVWGMRSVVLEVARRAGKKVRSFP